MLAGVNRGAIEVGRLRSLGLEAEATPRCDRRPRKPVAQHLSGASHPRPRWLRDLPSLDAYLRHTDAVETKAGVVLAAAGALSALGGVSPWRVPALGVSILAALAALRALVPRVVPRLALRETRDAYLRSERRFTELMLLDSGIRVVELMQRTLQVKTSWLRRASLLLALAAAFHGVGSIMVAAGG
jgi:hypothetical protein